MGSFRNFLLCLLLALPVSLLAQVTLSTNTLNFFTVFTGTKDSLNLTLTNNTPTNFVVTDVDVFHSEAFSVSDHAFTVAPGGNRTLTIYCEPKQNVKYADWITFKSPSHPINPGAFLFAFCKHSDTYYDLTFDKYNEELKSAMKIMLGFGYLDLGYNPGRDHLFMTVDNKAVNGQGAAQNTIECVYTGTLASGYTNRQDCQDNYNFNTEHVFPQSFFSQLQPMRSDLHHLLPSTSSSNGERSNNPFGEVSNPNWSSGGSTSNGNTFEPRDQAKGDIARAMMYFVIRYQDYNGFMAPQEAVLRNWHYQFPPGSIDRARNHVIDSLQHNRNPFVDHPEFIERIASITSLDNGDQNPMVQQVSDTLNYGDVGYGTTVTGFFRIANQGIDDLILSNLTLSAPEYTIAGSPNLTVPKDSSRIVWIDFSPTTSTTATWETLTFNTNAPNYTSVTVHLYGAGTTVSIEPAYQSQITFSPNPARDFLKIGFPNRVTEDFEIEIMDLSGKKVLFQDFEGGEKDFGMNLADLSRGLYLVRMKLASGQFTKKLLIK